MKKRLKYITALLAVTVLSLGATLMACPVCERQQPKILRGVAHGQAAQDKWDYMIATIAVLVVVSTLFFSIKYLSKPKESELGHIKRLILIID